jgi:hypothetical protein
MTIDTGTDNSLAPNWRHVGAFLGLTFGLTWLLDLVIYLRGGLGTPGMVTVLQLQMLLPAYLRALNNQVAAFIVALGFRPFDTAFSFGIGVYGIATLTIVARLVLRDPIWRGKGSNLT